MAAPAGGILAAPMAARRGRIQYRLDALADPARGYGLRVPDRLQDAHHQPGVDLLDGQGAEERVDIGGQRVAPLVAVLGAAPARLVRLDEGFRRIPEGDLLGARSPLGGHLPVAGADGVDPRRYQPARFGRPRTGFCEAHGGEGAQAHVTGLAVPGVAIDPGATLRSRDLEIKPAAVGMHAGPLRPRHRQRRQPPDPPRHGPPPTHAAIHARRLGLWETLEDIARCGWKEMPMCAGLN